MSKHYEESGLPTETGRNAMEDMRPATVTTTRANVTKAHVLLAQYDSVCKDYGTWVGTDEETVKKLERYSEAVEHLAHQFGTLVRDVFGED